MTNIGRQTRLALCAMAAAGLAIAEREGRAEPLQEQVNINAQSRTNVVGRASIELLRWDRGIGVDTARNAVAQRLALDVAGARDLSNKDGEQKLRGNGWKLTIASDGSSVRFRRDTDVPGTASRIEPEELTQLGLQLIGSLLSGIVDVGPGEELVPMRTRYERSGGQGANDALFTPGVVLANAIVFGRKVDGVPVVGPGFRVAIIFNSDRSLQAFDVDWPRLVRLGRFQSVVGQQTVWERAAAFSSARPGEVVDLRRMECGYVDLGARRRTAAPVQVGCGLAYAMTVPSNNGGTGMTHATVDIIPAGVSVEPDSNWPQARILCTGSAFCGRAPSNGPAPGSRTKSP